MNITLLGYGNMGKMIEHRVAEIAADKVILKINSANRGAIPIAKLKQTDVAIEFSNPSSVIENIHWCMDAEIPIVVGTTGWYDKINEVKKYCKEKNGAIVFASNFSIGVHIFFELNRKLAQLMNARPEYEPFLKEIHHLKKKDSPSGTAITLATDLLKFSEKKQHWKNIISPQSSTKSDNPSELIILSRREEDVVGTHSVEYTSDTDRIEIRHDAFSRDGFANGALAAANWIRHKKGFFEFSDVFKEL